MKFSQLVRGIREERDVTLPGVSKPDGTPVTFRVRPLTGTEELDVVAGAIAHAKAKGVTDPKAGDELFDLGRMVHALARASVDPDSPKDARTPFFDGGVEQVLSLHVEVITYLYEQQELHQAQCGPQQGKLSADDLFAAASEVAGPAGEASFFRMSPLTRWIFTRSLACQLLASREDKSPASDPAATSGEPTTLPSSEP